MSRREQNYHKIVRHHVVTSTSPNNVSGGEILPTYTGKVQYSARHYYNEHNNQSRSPVIRVNRNSSQIDRTPVHNRQGQLSAKQDLQKTQNNRKGNR